MMIFTPDIVMPRIQNVLNSINHVPTTINLSLLSLCLYTLIFINAAEVYLRRSLHISHNCGKHKIEEHQLKMKSI